MNIDEHLAWQGRPLGLVPPNDVLPNLRLLEQMWHALAAHPPEGYHLQIPEIVEYGDGRGVVKGSLQWVKEEA